MAGVEFALRPQTVPFIETPNRKIRTQIPAPGTQAMFEKIQTLESRSMHGQLPLIWARAEGHSIFDHADNKWIDFTSTIFVTNIGHAHPHLISRLQQVLDQKIIHSYAYLNPMRIEYLEKLIDFAPEGLDKAFLLSAGTEATEACLKLMRMNGQKFGKRSPGILCIEGNWHGRTMGAQAMSSNQSQKAWMGFEEPLIRHIPFPYPWALNGRSGAEFFEMGLRRLIDSGFDPAQDLAGVMLETFQGWGAVFYPKDFVQAIREFCTKNNILLCFDEMQAGFARTGKKFGFEHYDVTPDLFACGKGMGSGLPLSGVIGRAEVMDLPEVGNMSSTHSANPLVCAAGLATLEVIESEGLVAQSERKGKLLHSELVRLVEKYPSVLREELGKGMIAALIFNQPEVASKVAIECMNRGLLVVHTGRESIKLGPPLSISDEALIEGIGVLEDCVRGFSIQ